MDDVAHYPPRSTVVIADRDPCAYGNAAARNFGIDIERLLAGRAELFVIVKMDELGHVKAWPATLEDAVAFIRSMPTIFPDDTLLPVPAVIAEPLRESWH